MRNFVVVAFVLAVASLCSTQEPPAAPAKDPFIALVHDIQESTFFPNLDQKNRVLTFEMLAAAETANLELLFDRLGYIVILEYLDALPIDYQHRFIRYSIEHLKLDQEASA